MLAPPPAIATWWRLMAACAAAENGGIIQVDRSWSDADLRVLYNVDRAGIDAMVTAKLATMDENGTITIREYDVHGERLVEVKREAGRMGGRPRKQKGNNLSVNLQVKHTETSPETTNVRDEQTKQTSPPADAGFDAFWSSYPRKVGKAAARKAWQRAKPPLDACLTALSWQTGSEQWRRDNGAYVPHPATWINQGRWEDERQNGAQGTQSSAAQAYLRNFRGGRQ